MLRTAAGPGATAADRVRVRRLGLATGILLVVLGAAPARCATGTQVGHESLVRRLLLPYQGQHVAVLTVSSIEWGVPDRWSLTSRGAYMFGSEYVRDRTRWINALTLTASPGLGGGRLGLGYGFVPKFRRHPELAVIGEVRTVLLRTWGHPLVADADRSFAGAELRASLAGVVNAGVGWYGQVQGAEGDHDHFWNFHVGVGI
jgi:hypothetical protein